MILQIICNNDVYKMFQLKDDKKQVEIVTKITKLIPKAKFEHDKIFCPNLLCAKMITAYYRSEIYDS